MSLFPKFKIPSYTPANPANPANLRAEISEISEISKISNPIDTPKPDFGVSGHDDTRGVTAADVLRVFGGGRVLEEHETLSCRYCNEQKSVPAWRKGGKIIRRIWPDGRRDRACHFCGRASGNR